jgi:Ca2+-binding RTX toxin-like protein
MAGSDILSGGGGDDLIVGSAGNDLLTGGSGRDFFQFSSKAGLRSGFDRISDFASGKDFLGFDIGVFAVSGTGAEGNLANMTYQHLDPSECQSSRGHVAHSADVRIIYDESDGVLYYDSNGSKAGGMSAIADIGLHQDLSSGTIFADWT